MNISNQTVFSKQTVHVSRETIVSKLVGFGILFLLLVPNFYLFGKGNAVLDRPLYEWIDFALVGVWIVLLFVFPILFKRSLILKLSFGLITVSLIFSTVVYVLMGNALSFAHIKLILTSLRPIAVIDIVYLALLWCKARNYKKYFFRVVDMVAFASIFVSLLAMLQAMQLRFAEDFIHFFYRYDALNPDIAYTIFPEFGRTTSIFHWPNTLGYFFAIVIAVLLVTIFSFRLFKYNNKFQKNTILYWVGLSFSVIGLMLSGSRTSLLGVVALVIFIVSLLKRGVLTKAGWLIGFIVLLLMAIGVAPIVISPDVGYYSRLVELVSAASGEKKIGTAVGRENNANFAIRQTNFKSVFAWTGITIGSGDGKEIKKYLSSDSFDSELLGTFVISGVFGLIFFILFQILLLTYCLYIYIFSPKQTLVQATSLISAGMVVVSIVFSIANGAWDQARAPHIIFVFLAFLSYFSQQKQYLHEN